MKNIFRQNRKRIITWLFHRSQYVYNNYLKRAAPWETTKAELLAHPPHTFGHHLGQFLQTNGFDLIPKAERHDAYHLVTGYKTAVEDEIALQYVCLANGKRSPYLFGVIVLGTVLLPDYLPYYLRSFRFGRRIGTFHNHDYQALLHHDFQAFQQSILNPAQKSSEPESTRDLRTA